MDSVPQGEPGSNRRKLRAITQKDRTVVPGLSEHPIESTSSAAALLTRALASAKQHRNEGKTPGPRQSCYMHENAIVARLYIYHHGHMQNISAETLLSSRTTLNTHTENGDRRAVDGRTMLTFVEMGGEDHGKPSSSSSTNAAFLRCVSASVDGTTMPPCRDSLLTLLLKGTFSAMTKRRHSHRHDQGTLAATFSSHILIAQGVARKVAY